MKMSKHNLVKATALVCAAAMTTALVGCGGGSSASSAASAAASPDFVYDGTGPITDREDVTLTALAQASYYTNVDLTQAEIVKRVQQGAGVSVDYTLINPTNYADTVKPMLAAGSDLPDIVLLPDLDPNQTYIKSGLFEPLDTHFDEMPNFSKWLDANPSVKASLTASDGHIYYVCGTNVSDTFQPCIMYNMKWLKEAGFEEVPSTLDEFTELLRYYKEHDMNGNGDTTDEYPLSVQASFLRNMFGPAFGLDFGLDKAPGFYVTDDGKVAYSKAESPEYKEYLTYLNSLYSEGLLDVDYTTLTRDQIIARFANDQTGVTFDWGWQMDMTYSVQLPYYDGTPETGVSGAKPLTGTHEGYYVARDPIGYLWGVTKASPNLDLAIRYLDYAFSDENQDMYCWGIEGESFEVDADGNRKFTEKASDNSWLQQLGINPAQVLPARQSTEATYALVTAWHKDVDQDLIQYMRAPWPFIFAEPEEAEVVSDYLVDLTTYADEMNVAFITGTKPLSEYDNYLETLKSMHLDDLLNVYTAQYERYKSAGSN